MWRTYIEISCGTCGKVQRIAPPPCADAEIVQQSAKRFRMLGWLVGGNQRGDRCPDHLHPKAELTAAQKRAAYCHIAEVPRKEITVTTQPKPVLARASAPRDPTVADRRRIMDALEEHYDVAGGYYTASWSDEGLAEKLKTPRAWVQAVREMFFGESGDCQATAQKSEALMALESQVAELQDELLSRFAAIEEEIKRLKGPSLEST
jgi:hypothetical protein